MPLTGVGSRDQTPQLGLVPQRVEEQLFGHRYGVASCAKLGLDKACPRARPCPPRSGGGPLGADPTADGQKLRLTFAAGHACPRLLLARVGWTPWLGTLQLRRIHAFHQR